MKLNKILTIALAALTFTACSDDDSWNTNGDVTVSIAQSEMTISEDAEAGRYYYVPLVLSGETNGPVAVTVECKGVSANPATEDTHYVVTQKTVVIPAGQLSGNVEFYPTGDDEENPDRQFEVAIVKAEGATVAGNSVCTITLKDNERLIPEAYGNIQGQWNFEATDNRGNKEELPLTITGFDETSDKYLKKVAVSGWAGYQWVVAEADFSFDASTNQAILSFPLGQWVADEVSFNNLGVCDVMLASVNGNSLVATGSVSCTANEEMTEIEFGSGAQLVGALFLNADKSFTGSVWFWYMNMSMTR